MTEATMRMEGDYVIAENDDGHHIDVCDLDADIASLIAATAADICYGTIAFSRPKNNLDGYIVSSKVVLPAGVELNFQGSKLDLTRLNDIAFAWGSDEVWSNSPPNFSGIRNVHVMGAAENPNTWLAKATNINQGVQFDNCKMWTCNNGIEVRGASYTATLRNIYSEYPRGEFIRVSSLDANGYAPNNLLIDHAEVLGISGSPVSTGVNILASPSYAPELVTLRNCWLERLGTGVRNEGKYTNITGGLIRAINGGYAVHSLGNGLKISGGIISGSGPTGASVYLEGSTGLNVELNGPTLNYGGIGTLAPANAIVNGCKFYYTPTAIKGPWMYSTFDGNRMHTSTPSHVFASLQGAYYNTFDGNNIENGVIFVDGSPSDNTFIGNTISLNSSAALGNRCTFSNNTVTGNFTLNMGHSSIVMGNRVQGLAAVSIGGNSIRQGNLMTGG